LTVQFNESGFPVSVTGMRHKVVGEKLFPARWEGQMHDFELVSGMMIPTKVDVGWWEKDKLVLYFKGENMDLKYDFF
jgi:hypothetical protein